MNQLSKKDYFLYQKLLKMSQAGLHNAMTYVLKDYYGEKNIVVHNKFILAYGDIPIALCAHMDTVFPSPPKEIFYDREQNVIWSPQGAGHDDRAGIFMIIKILESGLRPHIILTTDEEIGCVGAEELVKFKNPFEKNLKYIIQLDRRGYDDCVFYWGDNQKFIKYVEDFGFIERKGSFTDIVVICPEWKICGVNLSVGYRDEHTTSEVLFVSAWFNTLNKVKKMLNNPPKKAFVYTEQKQSPSLALPYGYSFYSGKTCVCGKCKQEVLEEDVYPVRRLDGTKKEFCIDCLSTGVNWCVKCNEPFESLDPKAIICEQCAKGDKK